MNGNIVMNKFENGIARELKELKTKIMFLENGLTRMGAFECKLCGEFFLFSGGPEQTRPVYIQDSGGGISCLACLLAEMESDYGCKWENTRTAKELVRIYFLLINHTWKTYRGNTVREVFEMFGNPKKGEWPEVMQEAWNAEVKRRNR